MSSPRRGNQAHAERLRAAGLRVTVSRVAVLGVLDDDGHPTVEQILTAVLQRVGSVSQQAIYGVLRDFETAGLVRRIEPIGHPARYETRVGDNHHHLVCRSCGKVTDADCATGQVPCLTPARDAGYLVEVADVTYWGLCPRCRRRSGLSGGPPAARPGRAQRGAAEPARRGRSRVTGTAGEA